MNHAEDHSIVLPEPDATLAQQIQRLHQLTVYARWMIVSGLWLTIGSLSLWGLRYPISLAMENFTWAALRYGLVFDRLPAIGLATCIGATVAVLIWQSRNLLFGIPQREQQRLKHQVLQIRQQGAKHPLWKFICQN
jgi:hypothetical protein